MVVSVKLIAISLLTISLPVAWLGFRTITIDPDNTSRNLSLVQDFPYDANTPFDKQPIFPKTFDIEPVVDVPLPMPSCFLACAKTKAGSNDLTCHFREHYRKQIIGKLILDGDTFQIKSPIRRDVEMNNLRNKFSYSNTQGSLTEDTLRGEDPRTFMWKGDLYVLNNYAKHLTLIQVGDHGSKHEFQLPEYVGTKNITPIPLGEKGIMFVDFQMQKVHVCVPFSGDVELKLTCEPFWKDVSWGFKERNGFNKDIWYHRGGTNGVELETGVFVGFGHTTIKDRFQTHHDMWFWKLDTRPEKAYFFMDHVVTNHNLDHKITDPTSLVAIGDYWYLFTVESNVAWNDPDVVFINRVYRIKPDRCNRFGHCGR